MDSAPAGSHPRALSPARGPAPDDTRPWAVVLLEGGSDVAAVRAIAAAAAVDLERVRLVDLGGVTNVRRAADRARSEWPEAQLSALQRQPAWQGRPVTEQLHRFCGVASGRKELLAAELSRALGPDEVPEPIALPVERLAHG